MAAMNWIKRPAEQPNVHAGKVTLQTVAGLVFAPFHARTLRSLGKTNNAIARSIYLPLYTNYNFIDFEKS
jgi:hypothetical protein